MKERTTHKGLKVAALACAATLGLSASAVTKPLAIWNADFSASAVRGSTYQFTPYAMGNTIADGIVTIASSDASAGFTVECSNYNDGKNYPSTPLMAIAGVSDIPAAVANKTNTLITAGWVIYNSSSYYKNRIGVMLDDNGNYISVWNNGSYATPGIYDTSSTACAAGESGTDYMALVYGGKGDTSVATKFYLNGSEVYAPSGLRSDKDNGWRSVSIGGPYGVAQSVGYHTAGMKVKYLALLNSSSADDVAYWSLTDMTSVENASGAISGGANVGVNLDGTAASVAAGTTAQAVFVQDDTTLSLTPATTAALAITKPLYVADGKTLTIKLTSLPESDGSYPLISYANAFVADAEVALDLSDVSFPSGKFAVLNIGDTSISLEYGTDVAIATPVNYTIDLNGDITLSSITVGGDLTITGSGTITVTGAFTLGGTLTIDSGVNFVFESTDSKSITFPAGTVFKGLTANSSALYVTGTFVTDDLLFSHTSGTITTPANHRINTALKDNTDISYVTKDDVTSYTAGWKVYWVGEDNASLINKTNWRFENGDTPEGFPNYANTFGDHLIFTNAATVTTGTSSYDLLATIVTLDKPVTFKNMGNPLRAVTIEGETITLGEGAYIQSAGRAMTVSNDIVVEGTEDSPAVIMTSDSGSVAMTGDITGSGYLSCQAATGVNYTGVNFSGDMRKFSGHLLAPANSVDRNNTSFDGQYSWSDQAYFNLAIGNDNWLRYAGGTYKFGAFQGKGCTANQSNYQNCEFQIGALNQDDDTISGTYFPNNYRNLIGSRGQTLRKVGTGTLTSTAINLKAYIIEGGTLVIDGTESAYVTNYGYVPITFSGDGGILKLTENVTDVTDVSTNIAKNTSTGSIGYDTDSRNQTWAYALKGTGGLTKAGEGTLTLTATPSVTGPLVVSGGELVMPITSGFTTLSIADGAKLTLDCSSITSETADGILFAPAVQNGTTISSSNFEVSNLPSGCTAYINAAGTAVVVYKGEARTLTWKGPTETTEDETTTYDYAWTTASNWTTDGTTSAEAAPTAFDSVIFPSATPCVSFASATEILSITAANGLTLTNAYDLTVYGDLSVTGDFVKYGAGAISVAGSDATTSLSVNLGAIELETTTAEATSVTLDAPGATSSAATTATDAAVAFGTARKLSSLSGDGKLEIAGDITLTGTDDESFAGVISGTGNVDKTGSGTLTLFGESTFDGDFTISAGKVVFGVPTDMDGIRFDFDMSDADSFTTDDEGNITNIISSVGDNYLEYKSGQYLVKTESAINGMDAVYMRYAADGDASNNYYELFPHNNTESKRSATLFLVYQAASDADGVIYTESSQSKYALAGKYGSAWGFKQSNIGYIGVNGGSNATIDGSAQLVTWGNTSLRERSGGSGGNNTEYLGVGSSYNSFSGAIGEVVSFSRVLSHSERDAVEQYLMAKWGINDTEYNPIPTTAAVTVADGATLDLGGQTVTVASLNLSGTLQNGTLVVDGEITVTGTPSLDATVILANYTGAETAPAGYMYIDNGDGTATLAVCVAEINGTGYTTFADAMSHAVAGDTVTLLADVALTATQTIDKNLTIDLNGHNVTATDCRAFHVTAGAFALTGSGTVSTVVSANTALETSSSVIRVGSNTATTSFTLGANVTVSSAYCYGVTFFGTQAQTVVLNGTVAVTGAQAAISGNGTKTYAATTLTVNGTVSSAQDYAIYNPQTGTTAINGTVSGVGGIEAKSGVVTIGAGASITATGTPSYTVSNQDGTSTVGYAIASVSNASYKEQPPVVTVESGATVTGTVIAIMENSAEQLGVVKSAVNTLTIPEGFTWGTASEGYYTLAEEETETDIDPATGVADLDVASDATEEVAQAAAEAKSVAVASEVSTALTNASVSEQTYQGYFTKTAVYDTENSKWTVVVTLDTDLVATADADALAKLQAAAADANAETFTVAVPAGLYYKIQTFDTLGGDAVDTEKGLSTGETLAVDKPTTTDKGFVKVEIGAAEIQ